MYFQSQNCILGSPVFGKIEKFENLKILVLQFFGESKISEKFPKKSPKIPKNPQKSQILGVFWGKIGIFGVPKRLNL